MGRIPSEITNRNPNNFRTIQLKIIAKYISTGKCPQLKHILVNRMTASDGKQFLKMHTLLNGRSG